MSLFWFNLKRKLSIRPKIKRFLASFFLENYAADTELFFRLKALESTCNYISDNMQGVRSYTNKFEVLKHAIGEVKLEGLYCEFGVFKGETLMFIRKESGNVVHGFDSFEGLPEHWKDDRGEGHFKLKKTPSFGKNVELHVGWFENSVPPFIKNFPNQKAAFLHIDCDLYSSTQTIFNNFKDKIVSGTVIVFDEYFNYQDWENHEYKAFQEFLNESNLKYNYLCYNRKSQQVAVQIQ